jgi:hypothetical protein
MLIASAREGLLGKNGDRASRYSAVVRGPDTVGNRQQYYIGGSQRLRPILDIAGRDTVSEGNVLRPFRVLIGDPNDIHFAERLQNRQMSARNYVAGTDYADLYFLRRRTRDPLWRFGS